MLIDWRMATTTNRFTPIDIDSARSFITTDSTQSENVARLRVSRCLLHWQLMGFIYRYNLLRCRMVFQKTAPGLTPLRRDILINVTYVPVFLGLLAYKTKCSSLPGVGDLSPFSDHLTQWSALVATNLTHLWYHGWALPLIFRTWRPSLCGIHCCIL